MAAARWAPADRQPVGMSTDKGHPSIDSKFVTTGDNTLMDTFQAPDTSSSLIPLVRTMTSALPPKRWISVKWQRATSRYIENNSWYNQNKLESRNITRDGTSARGLGTGPQGENVENGGWGTRKRETNPPKIIDGIRRNAENRRGQ